MSQETKPEELPASFGPHITLPVRPHADRTRLIQSSQSPSESSLRFLTHWHGLLLLALSFGLGTLWAAAIRPLDAPDEPAHLQAIMEVRKQYRLPEIHFDVGNPPGGVIGAPGDQAVRDYAVSLKNPYSLVPYESTQPPLYYLAAGLVALPFPPDPQTVLYLSRLVAVLFGAGAVYFCWKATRQLAPYAPLWAVSTAAIVALLPQFCFNSATASNDSAANFAGAMAFYAWFRGLRQPDYDPWLLKAGAILGLAILAKLTSLALVPGLLLLLLFRTFRTGSSLSRPGAYLRNGLRMATGAFVGTIAICGWWLLRNVLVYGEVTGANDTIKYYTGKFVLLDLADTRSRDLFIQYSWESLWGRFGWLDISLPPEFYQQAIYFTIALVALSGLAALLAIARAIVQHRLPIYGLQAAFSMAAVAITLLVGYMQFNLTVAFEAQARYFFLLLLPFALLLTGGLYALVPGRLTKSLILAIPLAWLGMLNIVGLVIVSSPRS